MKQITAYDVRALQKETGEGLMWCKQELKRRWAEEEKEEMIKEVERLYHMEKGSEYDERLRDILLYLVSKA
jgi:translation elongation factor EF-Ts